MAQQKRPRPVQIAIYPPPPLYNLVVRESERRRRKLGPTCLEILWQYFERQRMEEGGINVGTKTKHR